MAEEKTKEGATPDLLNPPQSESKQEEKGAPPQAKQKAAGIESLQSNKQGEVQAFLMRFTPSLAQLLPSHLLAHGKRQLGIAAHKISTTDGIRNCDPKSIAQVVMQLAMSGLSLELNHAYLVPYGSQLQYQLGYKGLIHMAMNSGKVSKITAYPVYAGESFSFEIVDGEEKLKHTPNPDLYGAEVVMAYAIATMKDGTKLFSVIGRKHIEALRMRNASQKNGVNGAWKTDYPAMAIAKAVKQLCKFLPLSIEDNELIDREDSEDPIDAKFEIVD